MNKLIIQFFVLLFAFFGLWFGLSKISWTEIFQTRENASKMETKLGELYMESLYSFENEIKDKEIIQALDSIKERLCIYNNIDAEKIKVHVFENSEVNAFALPDNHLVIYSGLIEYCKSPEELAGVMAHEIAHMEKNHIMRKLSREIGFATLVGITNSGSLGMEAIRMLTSTAYDRSMEAEADETAVEYLGKSKVNPVPLADFMYRLYNDESSFMRDLTIISTHPASDDRAGNILELSENNKHSDYLPVLSQSSWNLITQETEEIEEE